MTDIIDSLIVKRLADSYAEDNCKNKEYFGILQKEMERINS